MKSMIFVLMKMGPIHKKYDLRTFRNRKLISYMYVTLKGILRDTVESTSVCMASTFLLLKIFTLWSY